LNNNKERFQGEYIYPEGNLSDMLDVIYDKTPDAVLTDFSLNEYKTDFQYEVEYDGGDLAKEIHSRRPGFPVFITTSLGDDAANGGADVKIIYEKYGSFNESNIDRNAPALDKQHLTFSDKLFHEIKAYKKFLAETSEEFDNLLSKRQSAEEGLSLHEERRLIELDGILEGLIDRKSSMPDDLKVPSNVRKLDELLKLAKRILGDSDSTPPELDTSHKSPLKG